MNAVQILVMIGFVGVMRYYLFRLAAEAISNSRKPIETLPVTVITKRSVSRRGGAAGSMRYYASFDQENGSQEQFRVSEEQYNSLSERERGMFSRQGTYFKGFALATPAANKVL